MTFNFGGISDRLLLNRFGAKAPALFGRGVTGNHTEHRGEDTAFSPIPFDKDRRMLVRVLSSIVLGIDAYPVVLEIEVFLGPPKFPSPDCLRTPQQKARTGSAKQSVDLASY